LLKLGRAKRLYGASPNDYSATMTQPRADQPIVQVDAFTSERFGGNPAAVCLLDAPRDDAWLQAVAREMNLSETAFLWPRADGFDLRWFTPTTEVRLCGHATLASAHALWDGEVLPAAAEARFHTLSGVLRARREGDWIALDFPAHRLERGAAPAALREALGVEAAWLGSSPICHLFEVDSEAIVRGIEPDLRRVARTGSLAVAVTSRAQSAGHDFVSRFFAPAQGIDEDPVTGAAHCCLGPYWAERLRKPEVAGYQASARGGVVRVRLSGSGIEPGRLTLLGQAVTVLRGTLV
jgi:PhzF family phenazine biosynthesis protein